jgi:AAA domain/RepB DNA-primase N-terminal domain
VKLASVLSENCNTPADFFIAYGQWAIAEFDTWLVENGYRPHLDREQAERFLALLDPDTTSFTFQTLADDKAQKKAHVFHGTLNRYWDQLVRLNDQGAGIFITVNETDLKGRKAKNIKRVRALFLDLDGAPLEPVMKNEQKPHIVVESSRGHFHVYWRACDVKLERFAELQKTLAARFDGDPAVCDLPRVMRLPGFMHQKGEPFQSRIVSTHNAPPYKVADFASATADNPYTKVAQTNKDYAGSPTQRLNDLALANLDAWVPEIFPNARLYHGGFRVSSADLGRDLQEDLSIVPDGIKDFGVHDIGDEREGRRTPIDIVMQYVFEVPVEKIAARKNQDAFKQACDWLRERLPQQAPKDGLPEQDKAQSSVIVRAADVKMRPKEWLWEGHLLRGGLELLTGLPGLGKSQVQIHFMACATAGLPWPNGDRAIEPVNVLMVTAEDAIDTEVVPRLAAARADLNRIHILKYIKTDKQQRQFLLVEDLAKVEEAIAQIGNVGLICIDPITAYMGGKTDSHKATEVRSQLGPLKDFAERTNVALSAITHPPKNASAKAIDHFIGSQAFIAAARVGHACFEEFEEDEETGEKHPTGRKLFANVKHNAHRQMLTLAYKIEELIIYPERFLQIKTAHVVWEKEAVDISADQAIAATRSVAKAAKEEEPASELMDLLRTMLDAGGGWCKQTDIAKQAKALGYSDRELATARKKSGIVWKRKGGLGDDGWWMWGWEGGKKPPRWSD